MTTWHPEGGDGEVLSLGREAPRSGGRARVGVTALVCLALGAVLGTQVDDAFERRAAGQAGPPPLVVGVIQENPDPADERRFALPAHTGGTAVPGAVGQRPRPSGGGRHVVRRGGRGGPRHAAQAAHGRYFAIDPDLFRFGSALDALGSFHLSGGTLWLTARGGHDCRAGEDTRWHGIETGEVWIARRA